MPSSLNIAMIAACPFPAAFASSGLIRELSLALHRAGHTVHVVSYHLGLDGFDTKGIHIHRISNVPFYRKMTSGISYWKPILDSLMVGTIRRVLKRYAIDIIHAHNYEAPAAAHLARIGTAVPMVYHAHNTMLHELPSYFSHRWTKQTARTFGRFLDRTIPPLAEHIIVLSPQQQAYLKKTGIPSSRITLVPPCIDPDTLSGGYRTAVRRRLGLNEEPLLIYTGGLQPYQNAGALIDLMRRVLRDIPDAHLLVVARSAPKVLQKPAVCAGLDSRVHFLKGSALTWERDCLAAADIGIIPRVECIGFPIKALNYLAAGLPVVCFEGVVTGLSASDGIYAVPPGNIDAMSRMVVWLLRQKQRSLPKPSVPSSHRWSSAIPVIESIYNHLLRA